MRKTDYSPQVSAYSGNASRRRKRKLIRFLRFFIFVMIVLIISVSCVLFWHLIEERIINKNPPVASSGQTTKTQTNSDETTTATDTTPVTTPVPEITELLAGSAIVDSYFGPLPQPEKITELSRKSVKGIYIGTAGNLEQNIKLTQNSEINAFVIDLKESYGVAFNSQNALAKEIGDVKSVYDLSAVVEQCHANDIWVIARIVCFKDPGLSKAHPELSIQDANGVPLKFKNEGNMTFVNPYSPTAWDYYIDLAIEAVDAGVDEIQFDYVRFPTGPSTTGEKPYFGPEETTPTRAEAVNRFLQTARRRIQDTYGVPVSADIFAIVMTNAPDRLIVGQDWPTVGLTGVDTLCPMIYPDHYGKEFYLNGKLYSPPKNYPYEIIYNALVVAKQQAGEGYSIIRPYLAAFNYGYDDINRQIKGAQDAGCNEFILWNANAEYTQGNYDGK